MATPIFRMQSPSAGSQAQDTDLDAIAALTTEGTLERTGAAAWSTYATTAAGRSMSGAVDKAAQRLLLGLDSGSGVGYLSAVAGASLTGTTEQVMTTVAIPAGFLGTNGALRITANMTHTGSTNLKTFRVRLGGLSGTILGNLGTVTATHIASTLTCLIVNRNSQSSQIGILLFLANTTVAPATGAVNTANAQDLVITGQLATGSESFNINSLLVEVLKF